MVMIRWVATIWPRRERFLDRGGHDIAGERQIGGIELKQLLFRDRVEVFHRSNVGAPDIRHEAHGELMGHERVFVLWPHGRNGRHLSGIGNQKIRRCRTARYLRKEQAALGLGVVSGNFDRRLGGLQIWIVIDRLLHQRIERQGFEGRPPARRNVFSGDEVLSGDAEGRRFQDWAKQAFRERNR